jgi:hypothetical protein
LTEYKNVSLFWKLARSNVNHDDSQSTTVVTVDDSTAVYVVKAVSVDRILVTGQALVMKFFGILS